MTDGVHSGLTRKRRNRRNPALGGVCADLDRWPPRSPRQRTAYPSGSGPAFLMTRGRNDSSGTVGTMNSHLVTGS